MARLNWGVVAERFFETGVDRGVLYTGDGIGVPWNGLTSVSEAPTGGDPKPAYIDGRKFRNIASSEEFEATIEAFAAPKEFGPCDGSRSIQNGLIATQQPRQAFSFSYRTLIGNPIEGTELGYKIHLVYNALAGPASRSNGTIGDSTEASKLNWAVTTLPPSLTGYKPTAHFVIDSTQTPRGLLVAIEEILYGNDVNSARMPQVSELVTMFQSEGPLYRRNLQVNPSFRLASGIVEIRRNLVPNPSMRGLGATGEIRRNLATNPGAEAALGNGWLTNNGAITTMSLDTGVKRSGAQSIKSTPATYNVNNTLMSIYNVGGGPFPIGVGEYVTASVYAAHNAATTAEARLSLYFLDSGGATIGATILGTLVTAIPGDSQFSARPWVGGVAPAGTVTFRLILSITRSTGNTQTGEVAWADDCLIEKVSGATQKPGRYFDGSTAVWNGQTYSWTGTAHASAAIATAVRATGYGGILNAQQRIDLGGGVYAVDFRNSYGNYMNPAAVGVAGEYYSGRAVIQAIPGETPAGSTVQVRIHDGTGYLTGADANIQIPDDGSPITIDTIAATATTNTGPRLYFYCASPFRLLSAMMQKVPAPGIACGAFFDGNTAASNGLTYSWVGTADASESKGMGSDVTTAPFKAYTAQSGVLGWRNTADTYKVLLRRDVGTSGIVVFSSVTPMAAAAEEYYAGRFKVRQAVSMGPASLRVTMSAYNSLGNHTGFVNDITIEIPEDGSFVDVEVPSQAVTPAGTATVRWLIYASGTILARTELEFRDALFEKVDGIGVAPGPYFDGATVDDDGYYYSWEGTAETSVSKINTWN